MSNRYTDTQKWDDDWFYALPGKMMLAWQYLNDHCTHVGIWKMNLRKMSDLIKFEVTADEFREHFGPKVVCLPKGRVWIPSFVTFQYKKLSAKSNTHRSIMRQIVEETEGLPLTESVFELVNKFKALLVNPTDTLPKGDGTLLGGSGDPQGKGRGKVKGEGKGKEDSGGLGENDDNNNPPPPQIDSAGTADCVAEWKATLKHFEIDRGLRSGEDLEIARAVTKYGADMVKLVFQGARKQSKSKKFDPAEFCSLSIYLHKDKIDRLLNIGARKGATADSIDWAGFWATKGAA